MSWLSATRLLAVNDRLTAVGRMQPNRALVANHGDGPVVIHEQIIVSRNTP